MRMMLRLWLISCGPLTVFGQQPSLDVRDVTERMQRRYEMIDDATAQYTEYVKFGFSNIEQTFSGSMVMKKPKKYRIASEHQTIVTDGKTVWAYSPVNNQVVVDRYKEGGNVISPDQFLLNLPENYTSTILGREKSKEGAQLTLKLVPKDDRSFVRWVKLWVEEETWVVRKISVIDLNDTERTYTIKDLKLNTNVKDEVFTFNPPSGAEVVDLRQ